jgi:hypothetical protein
VKVTQLDDPQQTPALVVEVNVQVVSSVAEKSTLKLGAVHCALIRVVIKKPRKMRVDLFIGF